MSTVILSKHAKKFAAKGASRPALCGIHYAADGSASVTDSHALLHVRNAHTFQGAALVDAKTGAAIEGQFPDVSKILEPHKVELKVELPSPSLLFRTCDAIISASEDKYVTCDLVCSKDGIWLQGLDTQVKVLTQLFEGSCNAVSVRLDAKYLLLAACVMVDVGKPFDVTITGTNSPIYFTSGDVTVLILPIRVAGSR